MKTLASSQLRQKNKVQGSSYIKMCIKIKMLYYENRQVPTQQNKVVSLHLIQFLVYSKEQLDHYGVNTDTH